MSTRAAACRGKKGMLLCVLGTLAVAPRAQTPTLHTRLAHPAEPAQTAATGQTDMPPAAEGEYPWGKPGRE
jgi:hypothetical protein